MAVSFIGVGNWRTWGKPPTCRKSLTNFYHIMLYTSIPCPDRDLNSQHISGDRHWLHR